MGQSPDPGADKIVGGGLTLSGKQAGWRGIYPGRSRTDQVKAILGEPASSEAGADGLTRLVYGPSEALKFNSVYVNGEGLVKKIGWALYTEEWRVPPGALWSDLGEPKTVSPFSFLKQGAIYQWAEASVWGVVDRPNNAVISLVFHDPADTPVIPVPSKPPQR